MKKILFIVTVVIYIFFFGRHLLPSTLVSDYHDVTQPSRVVEFSYNIQHWQFPPRISPHMSFGMGYPIFTFYAPFAYWITTALHFFGFDIADSLKLSFLMAITLSFIGMFFFLRKFFSYYASLIGALLYATSPYVAVEVFVRGNLGEVWFLALLPYAFLLLYMNAAKLQSHVFFATTLVVSFIFTVHNIFSVISIPLLLCYILFFKNKKRNALSLGLAFLSAAYFLVPFILESSFTNANMIARFTDFHDHFLCPWQLWTATSWGFGASVAGCIKDGMSFMLGKVQILTGILGIVYLTYRIFIRKETKNAKLFLFILFIGIGSAFMTIYASTFIWNTFSVFLGVFQFPWRFLIFSLFGATFFSAYFFEKNFVPQLKILIPCIVVFLCLFQSKYFFKPPLSKTQFNTQYVSPKVIKEKMAFSVAEYLPVKADFLSWRIIDRNPYVKKELLTETKDFIYPKDGMPYKAAEKNAFDKTAVTSSKDLVLNIHYLPYWKITINNKEFIPQDLDFLARPQLKLHGGFNIIHLYYQQTPIEIVANFISLIGIFIAFIFSYKNNLVIVFKRKLNE